MKDIALGRVAGKVAFVTGAAQGLGRAIAATLVAEGARVFVSDINAAGIAATAAEIGAERSYAHDVTDPAQWQAHVDDLLSIAGRLDILVNNAGIAQIPGPNGVEDVPASSWNRVIEVNGLGTLLGCQQAMAAMKEGGGSIVNLSSIAATTPTPTIAAYGFSKAGVAHLTRSVALAGAPLKIRCNSVHPGMIATPMIAALHAYHLGAEGAEAERAREAFANAIPMGEYQTEEDIALGVLFLASDEARFVTGAQLVIDGGLTL